MEWQSTAGSRKSSDSEFQTAALRSLVLNLR